MGSRTFFSSLNMESEAMMFSSALVKGLGVKIALGKSLISETGCAEFAHHCSNVSRDFSLISMRCLRFSSHPFGFYGIRERSNEV